MSVPKKSAWDGYRRWQKTTWLLVPAWFCMWAFRDVWPVFALIFLLSVFGVFKIQYFTCPGCDKWFFVYPTFPWFGWMFARKCMNCGLPKWEEPPPKPARADIVPIDENPSKDPLIAERLRLAKFLTLVLRDDPGSIGLRLDPEGWVEVDVLLARANLYGIKLTRETLRDVLTASENHRFDWDQPGNRIRVVQS